ncbi:hypothetical protein K469DRAFT_695755 [Zopfia rhizophila CBS 207.26]|uniref:Uncharacterized protein n=1 Tax=Zopfia rhizophila CBS 207.26 TaxID=1314779 RepID=A0A6A6DI41_9PEZI|nr:hypothetical protein K469DRAFT_695755 [Zopfia rhizophila CBS 207.26]
MAELMLVVNYFIQGWVGFGFYSWKTDYGPTLYKNLGFSPVRQLLYPAAWLTLALGVNAMEIPLVDRFPCNIYIGAGILGCIVTLIVEVALVANFVPSNNESALQAAVAMFFLFQNPYGLCLGWTQFAYLGELFQRIFEPSEFLSVL